VFINPTFACSEFEKLFSIFNHAKAPNAKDAGDGQGPPPDQNTLNKLMALDPGSNNHISNSNHKLLWQCPITRIFS